VWLSKFLQQSFYFVVIALLPVSFASAKMQSLTLTMSLDDWIDFESTVSSAKLLESVSRNDAAPGAVIASPSHSTPDYYYHWVRDGAITMNVLVNMYRQTQDPTQKDMLLQKLQSYVTFSRSNQTANTLTGLGEPKFFVDGTPWSGDWGRPQNDGPALRAITLSNLANSLLDAGQSAYVSKSLYDAQTPSQTVIKNDLEYVAAHWSDLSFDLWEEVLADHFFTRMVQRKALIDGAALARRLGDQGSSDWYLRQAQAIEASIKQFFPQGSGYILTSLNIAPKYVGRKPSNLDVASLLGMLHGNTDDGFFAVSSPQGIGTMGALVKAFVQKYPVNNVASYPGAAIGRYVEDKYDGNLFQGGNPWVLATLAMAQAYYQVAIDTAGSNDVSTNYDQLMQTGDTFMQRVQLHANSDGSLSEQINSYTGYMTSARDLTWNYAAFFEALWTRQKAQALKN
jgi:glucoamylase